MSKLAKLGSEMKALLRQGAKDLHNMIVPAFPTYSHGVDEIGTPGNPLYGVPSVQEAPAAAPAASVAPTVAAKPSFEQHLASQAPPVSAIEPHQPAKAMEL
jgi:hypothetical protein